MNWHPMLWALKLLWLLATIFNNIRNTVLDNGAHAPTCLAATIFRSQIIIYLTVTLPPPAHIITITIHTLIIYPGKLELHISCNNGHLHHRQCGVVRWRRRDTRYCLLHAAAKKNLWPEGKIIWYGNNGTFLKSEMLLMTRGFNKLFFSSWPQLD